MLGQFNIRKAIQVSAVLLKTAPHMSRLRLLKLLYIADRESLGATGRSITGDRLVAMPNGPAPSRIYNLIKGSDFFITEWQKFITEDGKRDLKLRRDPGVGQLSRFEIETLQVVATRFDNVDDWEVVESTRLFPEWINARSEGSYFAEIPLDSILDAVGLAGQKEELRIEAEAYATFDRILFGAIK